MELKESSLSQVLWDSNKYLNHHKDLSSIMYICSHLLMSMLS